MVLCIGLNPDEKQDLTQFGNDNPGKVQNNHQQLISWYQ